MSSLLSLLYLANEMRRGELDGIDATIADAVHDLRGTVDGLMVLLTWVGGGMGMAVVSISVAFALLRAGMRRAALYMAVASSGTLVLNVLLKLLFHRARPVDVGYLVAPPSSFSFPSGHAMGSMGVLASCVVVLYAIGAPRLLRRLATVVAALFVLGVAWSRVYLGVHYPSDIIGGQLAAAAWVSALTGWFYPRLVPGEEALEPAPEPGAP